MPTMKPINVLWKLVPAGKGLSMIQSEPLPTEEAQLRLDDLDKEEAPGEPEELEATPAKAPAPQGMPAFGKKPAPAGGMDMAAMMSGQGGGARPSPFARKAPAMPPFAGM
jgi:hypothetical protein